MKTKLLALSLVSVLALTLAACSKEAPAPAAKKEDTMAAPARPMPPAAPTAAPAEGDKHEPPKKDETKK